MESIALSDNVGIVPLAGRAAKVIGIWKDLYGEPKYLCEYATDIGSLCEHWLPARSLTESK